MWQGVVACGRVWGHVAGGGDMLHVVGNEAGVRVCDKGWGHVTGVEVGTCCRRWGHVVGG